nr:hypothetical protein PHYPA_020443 [Physcomitrium patens]
MPVRQEYPPANTFLFPSDEYVTARHYPNFYNCESSGLVQLLGDAEASVIHVSSSALSFLSAMLKKVEPLGVKTSFNCRKPGGMDQECFGSRFNNPPVISLRVPGSLKHQSQAESTECAEKVEAMLSLAVLHLADLMNLLTLDFSEGLALDPDTRLPTPVTEIPPVILVDMKSKLEKSLEWCHLARSRLRDITQVPKVPKVLHSPSTHQDQQVNFWETLALSPDWKIDFASLT